MAVVKQILILMLILMAQFRRVQFAQVSDTDELYRSIFTNYNPKLLPVLSHRNTTDIYVSMSIVSLNQFNEISGEISISLIFIMSWMEQRINWLPSEHDGQVNLLVPPEDVWRPQLFIIEASDRIEAIGNMSLLVRLYFTGVVSWFPGKVVRSTCSVDVTHFPFDTQTCVLRLLPWGVQTAELRMLPTSDVLNLSYYHENSEWSVMESRIFNYSLSDSSCIQLDLVLKRRSRFYIVYILVPLVFLSILNNLVFLMPADSGERTSVAITAFLSFVVYMGIVNDNVPASSNPMSYLYYYLLFLMVYSAVTMFLCILSLRIYEKNGEIPWLVKRIVTGLHNISCCRSSFASQVNNFRYKIRPKNLNTFHKPENNSVFAMESSDINVNKAAFENDNNLTITNDKSKEITWQTVGKTFDKCMAAFLMVAYVCMTAYTYVHTYGNSKII